MSFYQSFHLSGSNALVIGAALGALAGLYFFFRGFFLLNARSKPRVTAPPASNTPTTTTITTTTTFSTRGGDTLTEDSRGEVIRLTPNGSEPTRATSMSQQGKIAAALLRAGIPNPASWSTPDEGSSVAVKFADSEGKSASSSDPTPLPDLKASKILKTSSEHSSLRIPPRSLSTPPDRKPRFMLWGGALLALSAIYLLIAHLGWL